MTIYLPRSAWTTHGPVRPLTQLIGSEVRGVALHWPGTTAPIGAASQSSIAGRLEGYRLGHTRDRGWSDIAYQVAVDQVGRVWTLRGIGYRSAANGDQATNRAWGALLLLVGPGERPTSEMVAAIQDWRAGPWLDRYPHATKIVGHGDIRPEPTECPGPAVRALIASGDLLEDAMPTPGELWAADVIPVHENRWVAGDTLGYVAEKAAAQGKALDVLDGKVELLAADVLAVKAKLDTLALAGVDTAALAQAVADLLAARLAS